MVAGFIITRSEIIVVDNAVALEAIVQRMQASITSGEATAYMIEFSNNAAPIVEAYGNADTTLSLIQDVTSQDLNATIRDSVATVLGTLAFVGALPAGPAAAVAADIGMSTVFQQAYDDLSAWSSNQDWEATFDWYTNELANCKIALQDWLTSNVVDLISRLNSWFGYITDGVSSFFTSAQAWVRPRDPLTLDLDGDGIETVGINPNNPILFDHDGDGIKTATGWIAPDDGFLALDRNGNNTIDSGKELFGDSTPLSGGGTAADGFAALADLDSNADGVIDSNDDQFNNLRIWQDLNQNGISESNELSTLAQKNIVSINTASTLHSQVLADGNRIDDLGSYTKDNGETGTTASGSTADVDLSENTFYSNFTDTVPLTPEAQALPNMQGSGQIRDLREAASLSPELTNILTSYSQATTRDAQLGSLDLLIAAWSATSNMTGIEQRAEEAR